MSISISRIHSWTSTATSHKVLELDLALPAETLFMFPNSLLSAESLNILKLLTYSKLVVPSFIRLPNLKTLHFAVEFPEDHTGQKLFSGCPVLQELGLIDCYWKHTERDTISIPYFFREEDYLEARLPSFHSFDSFEGGTSDVDL
ncbi:hypothetical protein Patl1_05018 [Pistacia atlantica]|uniref:Uncharacterized protein n=1 Tax=Pistacia atlantica TaxID=434234 RepID=A0ACC1BPC8_9ROSI|nr:hypothetical protein Patl1_05018 [Pistacia atlantica]